MNEAEGELRRRLGVPADAQHVLLFTESSHWDPDWLLTSTNYFRFRVRGQLDSAIKGLIEDPRRVYSVECAFYVRMYWESRPERQETVRDLVNSGRLRLMGSGVTTPDTLIPSTESLIRDYLVGQEWYRSNGMVAEPEIAYFPDSFGHSPAMPTIMRAAGYTGVAVCRVDGMYFIGCENELPGKFPRPGTTAEFLSRKERTQDFIWRSPDGSQVQAHWVAYGYGQGELLAHAGATRVAGAPLAVPVRTDSHIARRVARYVKQLSRLARTPYMLCPIGFDFSEPIPRLLDLLDRYNDRHYPVTGTWVVNAGLDDYFALVGCHREELPVIELDPNPYFSGFYTSRPTVKRRCRVLADALVSAEARALATGDAATVERVAKELEHPWWVATTSNHHDFVTGTGTDRVAKKEQLPWLDEAVREVDAVTASLPPLDVDATGAAEALEPVRQVRRTAKRSATARNLDWRREGTRVVAEAPFGRVVFDEELGGTITSVEDLDGRSLLGVGPAFDVASYVDWGGLWRMGNEFAGGRFELAAKASQRSAAIEVTEVPGLGMDVTATGSLDGSPLTRTVRIYRDPSPDGSPFLALRAVCTVPNDRTVTALFPLAGSCGTLTTDVPGGVVDRAARNWFDPTFWSAQSFVHVRSPDGYGVAALLALPGAASLREDSAAGSVEAERPGAPSVEVILARNATKERFLGFVPMLGFPARGHDPGPHTVDIALAFTASGDWRDCGLVHRADRFVRASYRRNGEPHLAVGAEAAVVVDGTDLRVLAAKPADRGSGVIVRIWSYARARQKVTVSWPGRGRLDGWICDGRERDVRALGSGEDTVELEVDPGVTSVRLVSQ